MKILPGFILLTNQAAAFAQNNENSFEKVIIEIDGEEVFDVIGIAQDHQGYIWMNSNLGLIRYNGLEGKKYPILRSDSSSASYAYIQCLFVDYAGDLWIGSNSGLSKYSSDCDCLYQYPSKYDNYSLNKIRSITEDKNKTIWIGSRKGGLFRYERESDSFTEIILSSSDSKAINFNGIYHLLADKNNNLWIGSDSGLIRYHIGTEEAEHFTHDSSDYQSLMDNRITALYEDQQGRILIGTYKSGFHIFDPGDNLLSRINFDPDHPEHLHAPYSVEKVFGNDPRVNLIHQDKNGDYWIGTTGSGINSFNSANRGYKHFSFDLVNPEVLWALFEDRQGNIWVGGGMGSGLFKSDLFARKYHLNTSFINVQAAYESTLNLGFLWVGSQENGLSKLNLETHEITKYHHNKDDVSSIGHSWVRSVYQENKQSLWVGLGNGGAYGGQAGDGGIDRMDLETETFIHFKLTRSDDGRDGFSYTPYNIVEDSEGYLWLGTGPGGIFRSNKDKTAFSHFKIPESENAGGDVYLNIAHVDSNGDIWASDFAGEGTLYLYDRKENKFKPYLKGFKMVKLVTDEKGWLLISTWEKGLIHLNPANHNYVQYTKEDGLPSNSGVNITGGENGIYWINTRTGPAKFDIRSGLISPVGLPKIRYNVMIFKASDDLLYLGGNNGLYSFHSDQILGNPYPPQIDIGELLISEENYLANSTYSDEIILSHKQNDIAFKYTGLHYSNPEKNSYQYKLDPVDDKWVNAGYERTVRFANLSPGTYTFHVKAANSDGIWSDQTESVLFTIKPAWWNTWLAYIIYLALAIAFADRFYRFQLSRRLALSESNRLKEIDQLKNTLFTNITHEFRTPLTVINGMTDSIKSDIENKQFEDTGKSLEMIHRNSNGLLHLVNDMLDLAKLESGNMELKLIQANIIPFVKYLGESFHSLAEKKQINLTVYSEVDRLMMDFDSKKLSVIITNVLSNAVKFTPSTGKIVVHLNRRSEGKNELFVIKIKDNGPGMSEEEMENVFDRFYQASNSSSGEEKGSGLGLALSKEFVELLGGNIEVSSEVKKGCTFIITFPISNKAKLVQENTIEMENQMLSSPIAPEPEQQFKTDSGLPLVLIIEDNEDVAFYLKKCLAGKYESLHAKNGIEGIEMACHRIPDIIISDVMMPGKDGFAVCETLKTDELTDHIPIIMLTAKATIQDRLTGLSHGADAYLTKPFVKAELFTRLDQLILSRSKLRKKFENSGFSNILNKRSADPETKFLQKVVKAIHENISNHSFGAVQLAHELGLSESQVYRKLKAISGKSTAVFIRSIRLQKGKELIQTSSDTISEIAYEVGFNDPAWFSRAFKDEFGFAPSAMSK